MAAKKRPQKSTKKATGEPIPKLSSARRQLWAIILFAISVFLLFVVLIDGSNVWGAMHSFILGIFGICGFFLPFILGYLAVMNTLDKPMGKVWHKVIESTVLVILLGAAIDIFSKHTVNEPFFSHLKNAYLNGTGSQGGGFLGALIGYPLYKMLGSPGAGITIVILIFVFFMLITGTTLLALFHAITKPVKSTARSAQEMFERRAQQQEQKRRFEIDIPVDGESRGESSRKSESELVEELSEKQARLLRTYRDEDAPQEQEARKPLEQDTAVRELDEIVSSQQAKKPEPKEKADSPSAASAIKIETGSSEAYRYPPVSLLDKPAAGSNIDISTELKANAARLVDTLKSFGVETRIVDISRGPAVTRYELQPSAGVKISKITNLSDDIALNLATAGVRIEAPIPNKPAVGIEVPNKTTSIVYMRELIDSTQFTSSKSKLTVALGKDIAGNITLADIAKMPHMLIAGATGSGKSVCINSIIISILYKSAPEEVKLLMIDPKVVELGIYNGIPHLITPVVTDPRKAAGALGWAVTEMLNRYKLFADNSVRDVNAFNALAKKSETLNPLPQIVIVIDELADLMMAAPNEVEDSICRLAQMARAAGMHLVIATQRPSVDVITGIIKANIPSRVAFMVSSQVDSRTILDMGGAEKLMGKGDMLFYPVGAVKPSRIQGCWVSEREVESVVTFIKSSQDHEYDDHVMHEIDRLAAAEKGSKSAASAGDSGEGGDEMLPQAIEVVVEAGLASTSLLQRRLKLGYARAARIIDEMESRGIVGPFEGSKPRQVLITRQQWMEMQNQ